MEISAEIQSMSLEIVNKRSTSVEFVLELWGEQYTMPPKATYTIILEGHQLDAPVITIADNQIIVTAPFGAVAGIIHEGIELGPGLRNRRPF